MTVRYDQFTDEQLVDTIVDFLAEGLTIPVSLRDECMERGFDEVLPKEIFDDRSKNRPTDPD